MNIARKRKEKKKVDCPHCKYTYRSRSKNPQCPKCLAFASIKIATENVSKIVKVEDMF